MNNFGFKAPVPGGELLRNRDFKKAQNRVAVLLFMVTGTVQYVSVVFIPFLLPGVDPFIYSGCGRTMISRSGAISCPSSSLIQESSRLSSCQLGAIRICFRLPAGFGGRFSCSA